MTTEIEGEIARVARAMRDVTVRVIDGTRGAGSGVVWPGGDVVSNAHVVRGTHARVVWEDGLACDARVLARDDARSGFTPSEHVTARSRVRPNFRVRVSHYW